MKAIKPARLKEQVFRLGMLNALHKAAREIKTDFQETVKTWDHPVTFQMVVSLTGPGPVALVGTDDLIYKFVSGGTKKHDIWAGFYTGKSEHKSLSFQGEYRAKTTPKVIGSTAGGSSGPWRHTPYVMHPGTKAREFDEEIQQVWKSKFKTQMEAAMRKAARDSGNGA